MLWEHSTKYSIQYLSTTELDATELLKHSTKYCPNIRVDPVW